MQKRYTLILLALLAFKGHSQQNPAAAGTVIGQQPSISIRTANVPADSLDAYILSLMQKRQVPGLSLAVIQDGKIVKAKGYGFIDKTGTTPVTEATLFQAGSISKSVAAAGALYLVENNKLSLDEDVNTKLRSWKVPENEFTENKKVTLRGILSHTAGLTVQGFPGYQAGGPIPTVIQILDGAATANNAAVRVDFIPGSQWRYSGGGYTIMQQLIMDVTGRSFPDYMQEAVLKPLNMQQSTYQQPLPATKAGLTATAHSVDRDIIVGRWHIYPEMAAAGLWTTPSDLARFAISIHNGFAGKSGSVLSQSMTRQMLTAQKNNDGLGLFLQGEGHTLRFGHGGVNEGFAAFMTAGSENGHGVVIMINANDNSRMIGRIESAVAEHYRWEGFPVSLPINRIAIKVNSAQLAAFEGRYELQNNRMITFQSKDNHLFSLFDGITDEEFVPLSATQFASTDREAFVSFSPDEKGQVTALVWKDENEERQIPRIGPLFTSPISEPDPNPARTKQMETALQALFKGGKILEETPGIAAGTRRAFIQGSQGLGAMKSIRFIHSENVAGRDIQRHGSEVSEIATYLLANHEPYRYAIIHLTSDGLIADCDVVDK